MGEGALMTHSVVIHSLTGSWYPRRKLVNPTGGSTMDVNLWRFPCVVEEVEEACRYGEEVFEEIFKPTRWSLSLHA